MKYLDILNVKHGDFGIYHNVIRDYICVIDCGTTQPDSRLYTNCLTPRRVINYLSKQIASVSEREIF